MAAGTRIALYTTVYPGVEKFLTDWYGAITRQSDNDFDLWVGVDAVEVKDIVEMFGEDPGATWIIAETGDSPATIRQNAIRQIVERYSAVAFVDSDDVVYPTRIEAARAALATCDVYGCAMDLVDEGGEPLGLQFRAPDDYEASMPRMNVLGLSNTAYRTDTLRHCLPVPPNCVLVDWLFASRAWARHARLSFDPVPRMAYRRYGHNTAPLVPPFTREQLLTSSTLVCDHYGWLLKSTAGLDNVRVEQLVEAAACANEFRAAITGSTGVLDRYLTELNTLKINHAWWSFVAHPALEDTWKS